MRIFQADGLNCSVETQSVEEKREEDLCCIELTLEGRGSLVWPNREGEIFLLSQVYSTLAKHNCLKSGISIAWPATASSRAVMLIAGNGEAALFRLHDDPEGRHADIRIFADSAEKIRIRFTTVPVGWEIAEIEPAVFPRQSSVPPGLQFQVGLIGPDGKPGSAEGKTASFGLLPELAGRFAHLAEKSGFSHTGAAPPLIHLFGYAAGHDREYPDYTPSPLLGGYSGLTKAAAELHSRGFMLSCYLNARLAEEKTLERYPLLAPGVCRDERGNPIVEIYQGRRFNIMDPSFEPWIEHLYLQAVNLRDWGADAVQLDQIAGRAPVTAPGQPWGAGYQRLILLLRKAGLKVWIQGVSDYYPADWYEMTYRDIAILPGGVLRGGNPIGETDLRLLLALQELNPRSDAVSYLVPLEKARRISGCGLPLILDLMGARGSLPLFGEGYLKELSLLETRTLLRTDFQL